MANAAVVLVNTNLAIHRETKTDSDGTYLFPLVPPASGYELDVEAPGFAKAVIQNIVVQVTVVTTMPPHKLMVRTVTTNVEVMGATQTVNTSAATTGNVLPEDVIANMPLNTRNTLQLLATDAGVAADSGSLTIFAAGSRSTYNDYSLNGINSNNFEFNTLSSVTSPVPDAVQELRTQTSLYDSTVGRNSGAAVVVVSRSGTSKFHGTAYEYNRNRDMAANNYFLNKAGISAPPFLRNEFGGSVGGPVPKLNHTFWFFNYDGTRQRQGVSVNGFLPVLPSSRDAASLASAFSLPVSAIDPVAVNYLSLPGKFNGSFWPSGSGAPVGQLGTFNDAASESSNYNQETGRVDHDFRLFGGTNRISGIAYHGTETFTDPTGLSINQLSTGGRLFTYSNGNYSIEDTQIFNPNLLNDFTIGFNKYYILGSNSTNPITLSQVGMSRFNSSLYSATPELDFADQFSGFGTNEEAAPHQLDWVFSARDMITQTHNKHTFRYGFETDRNAFDFHESYDFRGEMYFLPVFADAIYGPPANPAGDISLRDFLVGSPYGINIASGVNEDPYRATDLALFFQDDYRVARRLTLNLGLRWDRFGNINSPDGRISSFDPGRVPASAAQVGGAGILPGFLIPSSVPNVGTPGVSNSVMYNQDELDFAPRFGFAYDVFGNAKLAVRGGYGIYYNRTPAMSPLQTSGQAPYGVSTANYGFNGTQILSNPFPTLPLPNQFPVLTTPAQLTGYDSSGNPIFNNPSNILYLAILNPRDHTPYVEEWNLTIGYEFVPGWSLEAGYLGSHGQRLLNTLSLNDALLRNSNNPAAFGLATDSSQNFEARVPVVGLSPYSYTEVTNAVSFYDAFLLTVQHQFAKGLFFKAAYTFSKSIDDSSACFNFDVCGPGGNQFIPLLNKGLSDFDQRQRIVFTYLYNLPGPSRGALRYAFGGWSLGGITALNSGFPITVSQYTFGNTLSGNDGYATGVAGCSAYLPGGLKGTLQYLNPACFTATPVLTAGQTFGPLSPYEGPGNQTYTISPNGVGQLQGTIGRNTLRGPFRQRWDVSLAKSFPIRWLGESGAFTLRGDFFQLFNHPVFSNPNSTVGLPGFGQILSTTDIAREIQVSGRITF